MTELLTCEIAAPSRTPACPDAAGPLIYRAREFVHTSALTVCEPRPSYTPGPPGDALSEAILQAAWRRAGERRLAVLARDGHTYRVLYPGRPGPGRGPDFLDAVLEREDGARLCGDIEVHVRPGGWRDHGHGSDRRYNGVVLHVAYLDGGPETENAAGVRVPLLVLGPANVQQIQQAEDAPVEPAVSQTPPVQPQGGYQAGPAVSAPAPAPMPFMDLGAAGDQRFLSKSAGLEMEARRVGPDQTLYASVLECLGYPRNRSQFRKLAMRLPWGLLSGGLAPDGAKTVDDFKARRTWAAGFGPKPLGAPSIDSRAPEWDLPGGRPDNHPKRRISGAAALAARWRADGGPASALSLAVMEGSGPESVMAAFMVGDDGSGARAFIGQARAGDMAVNAVLPGLHAVARLRGDAVLASRCLELFRAWPKLPENAITREARLLLAGQGLRPDVKGAREQQGLHLLYRAMTSPVVLPRQLPLL